jgi:hypothetical protein
LELGIKTRILPYFRKNLNYVSGISEKYFEFVGTSMVRWKIWAEKLAKSIKELSRIVQGCREHRICEYTKELIHKNAVIEEQS